MYAHAYVYAVTKVISLSEDAYKALKRRKGKGESFSDVVIKVTEQKESKSILEFAGTWVGNDVDKIAQQIRREREVVRSREHKFSWSA